MHCRDSLQHTFSRRHLHLKLHKYRIITKYQHIFLTLLHPWYTRINWKETANSEVWRHTYNIQGRSKRLTFITDVAHQSGKIIRNIAPTNQHTHQNNPCKPDSLSKTRKPQVVNAGEVALKWSINIQHTSYFVRRSADCPDQVFNRPLNWHKP